MADDGVPKELKPISTRSDKPSTNGHKPYDASLLDLDWLSGIQITQQSEAEDVIRWIWEGYLRRGSVTLIAGRPKAGKSTLLFGLIDAIGGSATSFLDRGVIPEHGFIPYVTEEGSDTLAHKVSPYGRYWTRHKMGTTMSDILASAKVAVETWGAQVMVIDTFSFWSSMASEAAKDTGAVEKAMKPILQFARDHDVAILLVHHLVKDQTMSGEVGVSGSTAFSAIVDIVLTLTKPRMEKNQNEYTGDKRIITSDSRYPSTPKEWIYGYNDRERAFRTISQREVPLDAEGNRIPTLSELILDKLTTFLEPVGTEALIKYLGKRAKDVRIEIDKLEAEGLIVRVGEAGKKQGWTLEGTKSEGSDPRPDPRPDPKTDPRPEPPSDPRPDTENPDGGQ